jgi:(4S)-4-hydroxy-5-phosphonooxypentane-2,3-dione isomerase
VIVLLVQFTVKPGQEQRCLELMRTLEQHTRTEPGCVQYVGHQSTEDPRRFFLYETYQDEAALAAHRNAPYFAQYVKGGLDANIEQRERELFVPVS